MKLRMPPSGPVLAEFGTGFRLRLAESKISINTGSQAVPTTPSTVGNVIGTLPPLAVGFATAPQQYRATFVCDVQNTSTAEALVQLDLQADWGFGFVTVATSTHALEGATARQIRVDCPQTLGTPPPNATKATFIALISNGLDGTHVLIKSPTSGPTIDFQVEELLP